MPASKIVNEDEARRWVEEGRTYQWIVEEYRRKYNIETTLSMWGNFRRTRSITRRTTRDVDLIPWRVEFEHRWTYPVSMLRLEAKRRAGRKLSEREQTRLAFWLKQREVDDTVVHYDPDTDEGFFYVPRRPGIDTDLVRVPEMKTGRRAV